MSELTVPEKESRRKYSYERKKVRENDHMRKKYQRKNVRNVNMRDRK